MWIQSNNSISSDLPRQKNLTYWHLVTGARVVLLSLSCVPQSYLSINRLDSSISSITIKRHSCWSKSAGQAAQLTFQVGSFLRTDCGAVEGQGGKGKEESWKRCVGQDKAWQLIDWYRWAGLLIGGWLDKIQRWRDKKCEIGIKDVQIYLLGKEFQSPPPAWRNVHFTALHSQHFVTWPWFLTPQPY